MEQKLSDPMTSIDEPIFFNDDIESFHYNDINLQSLSNINTDNSVLNFDIQAGDKFLVPSKSDLVIRGKLVKENNALFDVEDEITLINNAIMYLFKSIELRIGNNTIERLNNPGQTSSILGYLTYPDDFNTNAGLSICWSKDITNNANSLEFDESAAAPVAHYRPRRNQHFNQGFAIRKQFLNSSNPRGQFSFIIPFSHMFGFSEYEKYLFNIRISLLLTRGSNTLSLFKQDGVDNGKIVLQDIIWRVPEIRLSPHAHADALRKINDNKEVAVSYTRRRDDMLEIPNGIRSHTWKLSDSSGIQKPRWLIVAFQTNKSRTQAQNPSVFDHSNIREIRVKLNSEFYPKTPVVMNFGINDYSRMYKSMDEFKKEFYGYNSLIGGNQINYACFKSLFPIFVFDLRRQSEILKSGVVDIEIKTEFLNAVPDETFGYSVILSDSLYKLSTNGSNLVNVY